MKIALATNDRKTIAIRTGRAAEFVIYTIENGKTQSIDYQKNTHTHHNHERNEGNHRQVKGRGHNREHNPEHSPHTHDEIVNQLKKIDILLVKAIGKHMKRDLENGNIPYKLVKGENIEMILTAYLLSQIENDIN